MTRETCVCCPCDWYGLITVLQQFCSLDLEKVSGSYILAFLAPSCHSFRCISAKPIASLRKDKFHPRDCPVMLLHVHLGGTVLLFSCRFGCPPRKIIDTWEIKHGERNHVVLMAAEFELSLFFLQKRHGKNMSLALSFNRALQKCFAQQDIDHHWSFIRWAVIALIRCPDWFKVHLEGRLAKMLKSAFGIKGFISIKLPTAGIGVCRKVWDVVSQWQIMIVKDSHIL